MFGIERLYTPEPSMTSGHQGEKLASRNCRTRWSYTATKREIPNSSGCFGSDRFRSVSIEGA